MIKFVHFSAIILTAVILAPGLAHLSSLATKMALEKDAYFTTQGAYAGWSLFAIPLILVILSDTWLGYAARDEGLRFYLIAFAGLAVAASLVVFFLWVFPGNQATSNWTEAPANWRALRTRWEYGHAASAALTFLSLMALTAAAFLDRPEAP